MKVATISQTKNELSSLLDQVRHGETVLIVDRDRPIARLEPVGVLDDTGRLARLERAGLVRQGSGKLVAEIVDSPPPRARAGGDILRALLADREDSQ